ncbi:MAG: hypothetical protein QM541_13885 [Flavobacterium sp.]|nr:hypothetical protein [Flavobacterium sp.]
MNNNKVPKLRMFITVTNVCDQHATAYAILPAFSNAYTKFKGLVKNINDGNTLLQGGSIGITDEKLAKRIIMADIGITVVSALKAYAHATNNVALIADTDITKDDILGCKETDADDICLHIHDLGGQHLAALADYGIVQADLAALSSSITSFTEKIGSPRKHIIDTKTVRANITKYFKEADSLLLNQLDNLITVLKTKAPDFYDAYQAARIIVDLGGGSKGVVEKKEG